MLPGNAADTDGDDPFMERAFLAEMWAALGGRSDDLATVRIGRAGELPSAFPVTAFASAAVGTAGLAVADLVRTATGGLPAVSVDRRLASLWFGMTLRPEGWTLPPPWDPVAGDYLARDGWIRLHTNAPHHRAMALAVLGVASDKSAVAAAVSAWAKDELEAAIVERGGCAAAMRSAEAWRAHPQGRSVIAEPLIRWEAGEPERRTGWTPRPERPLAGLRVLDLTRILAGPIATRFLAGFGAEVLRIDPPDWDEPSVVPEVILGKRCARLDLKAPEGRARFAELLASADVLVHGYRPGALDRLGLDAAERQRRRPGLIDVSLDAYGWTGPWVGRRGFDCLVQMSCGIAEAGMRRFATDRPKPLPVQALDHATGYLLAASVARGLAERLATGRGAIARTSLARVAAVLMSGEVSPASTVIEPPVEADYGAPETTAWGPARRLRFPLAVDGAPACWSRPAEALGTSPAEWSGGSA
jgi:hypothetical protein